jgi:uncharacterized FlaG/YvyC family protein
MDSISTSGPSRNGPPPVPPPVGDRKGPRASARPAEIEPREERPDPGAAAEPISREGLEEAIRDANSDIETLNRSLSFRLHDGTGQLMVAIVDRATGDVIRTNPPEEFLDLAVRMKEMVGFFLDETR